MVTYFIGFAILGFFIKLVVSDEKSALLVCLGIAVLWGFIHHTIWGVVTLGKNFMEKVKQADPPISRSCPSD
jgi:hypothetical protein